MSTTPPPPPLVLVQWEDASVLDNAGPWVTNTPADYKPHIFWQVGFLLLDAPEGIHLTQAWHPDLVAARDQIPRAMIRSITPLQPAAAAAPTTRRKPAAPR